MDAATTLILKALHTRRAELALTDSKPPGDTSRKPVKNRQYRRRASAIMTSLLRDAKRAEHEAGCEPLNHDLNEE